MNDRSTPPTEAEVESRLRRTLALHVADVAASTTAGAGAPVPPEVSGGGARRRLPVLAAAVTVVVVGGLAAVAVAGRGSPDDRTDETGQPAAAPRSSTTGVPSADPSSCPVLTLSQGEDRWVTMLLDGTSAGADPDVIGILGDQWHEIHPGANRGYIVTTPDGASAVWLIVDEGIVRLQSGGITAQELTDVAATVAKDPATGCYTAPAPQGWDRTEDDPIPSNPEGPITEVEVQATGLGRFVNAAGASYNAIWYPGWTTDNLPDELEAVQVTDGQAYIGSIAPEADDLAQLWIVYDDGVVELQAAVMTHEELVAAGNGVVRHPGTTDFDVTPPSGYQPDAP
jgi:hypothetical protein